MKPYFEENGITIFHGDCREILPRLERCDVVITDPPYSDHVHSNGMRGARGGNGVRGEAKDFGFSHIPLSTLHFSAEQFARLAARWVLVFSDIESSPIWRDALTRSHQLEYIRTGAWVKIAPTPQFTGDRPAAGFEAVNIAHPRGKKKWNGGGKAGVWTYGSHGGEMDVRIHPTEKPRPLISELVALFSNPDELILDPFMGSGTLLVAAKNLGRRAIGIEIEEKYCEVAARRLGQSILDFEQPVQAEALQTAGNQ